MCDRNSTEFEWRGSIRSALKSLAWVCQDKQVDVLATDGAYTPGTAGVARHKVLGSDTPGLTLVPTICVTLDG